MEKDRENGNVLTGRFTSDPNKASETKIEPKNQTNPIYKQLFKLVHPQLGNSYKSFSNFKPKDLR